MTVRNLTILTGIFPARSETFVTAHAIGMSRRDWQVQVLSSATCIGMAQMELAAIESHGVQRSRWGDWSPSRAVQALQFGSDAMQDPEVLALLLRAKHWTRPEIFAARRMRRNMENLSGKQVHIHYGKNAALLIEAGWKGTAVDILGMGTMRTLSPVYVEKRFTINCLSVTGYTRLGRLSWLVV